MMDEQHFSQLPIMAGNVLVGIFSYRSFARKAAAYSYEDSADHGIAICDFPVDECFEEFESRKVTDEMFKVINDMERDNGVLIGTNTPLPGILTPIDLLRYLYNLTLPFVLLSEIENALRGLIKNAVSEQELGECIKKVPFPRRRNGVVDPNDLAEMTFGDYRAIIMHDENWPHFSRVFGAVKTNTSRKLKEVNDLRNIVLHFKRNIEKEDTETLLNHRSWFLMKAKQADENRKGLQPPQNNG